MKTAFRTSNPVFSSKSFGGFVGTEARRAQPTGDTRVMTVRGTVDRTAILLAVLVVGAIIPGGSPSAAAIPAALMPFLGLGLIGGFVLALVTVFKKSWAPVTAPLYAACEGLVLGGVSALFEPRYPGIVIQAVGLTFGTLAVLLVAYKTRADPGHRELQARASSPRPARIALLYLVSMVLGFFGVSIRFIH